MRGRCQSVWQRYHHLFQRRKTWRLCRPCANRTRSRRGQLARRYLPGATSPSSAAIRSGTSLPNSPVTIAQSASKWLATAHASAHPGRGRTLVQLLVDGLHPCRFHVRSQPSRHRPTRPTRPTRRRIAGQPAMSGRCCPRASTRCCLCCVPGAVARCGSSPSSPRGRCDRTHASGSNFRISPSSSNGL